MSDHAERRRTRNDVNEIDGEALDRALDITLAEIDQGRVEQVRMMLAEDGWYETAVFCAYHRQCESLNLSSAENPPLTVDEDDDLNHPGDDKALQLKNRMLALGLSLFDPTPMESIAAAKRRQSRKGKH
jgi:hypothetical protein